MSIFCNPLNVPYRYQFIRDKETGVELHAVSKTGTVRACAEWIVEGKTARLDLGNADPAVRTRKALAELQKFAANDIGLYQAF